MKTSVALYIDGKKLRWDLPIDYAQNLALQLVEDLGEPVEGKIG